MYQVGTKVQYYLHALNLAILAHAFKTHERHFVPLYRSRLTLQ